MNLLHHLMDVGRVRSLRSTAGLRHCIWGTCKCSCCGFGGSVSYALISEVWPIKVRGRKELQVQCFATRPAHPKQLLVLVTPLLVSGGATLASAMKAVFTMYNILGYTLSHVYNAGAASDSHNSGRPSRPIRL